ncbi:threonine aldolase 1 [Rhynchospora pubera]|uniref:low-specificity L-threonine aldolase n=2 Tax=Rhynchospora pubera TaxID=906938 RepID=A0AAV8G481_9POAL|nr:threonine aldolase 1 [Rhynchospora pubera]KAJ4800510.1 threonine aldolase 1 [Rhynchospora pubera]
MMMTRFTRWVGFVNRNKIVESSKNETSFRRKTYQVKMVARVVDLRSDTVTKPNEAMRSAMAVADVDDDVLGFDPTAQKLEMEVASIMHKDAALFVPSGTMANLISVMVHCEVRGSEVILGDNSHIHVYENGGISTIGGIHAKTLPNNVDGTMDIEKIVKAIRGTDGELYYPTTRLICLENTHANCGGRCLSVEYIDKVGAVAKEYGIKLHIDGARIFNASVALGVPVHRLVQEADSVSVCLSKGLGAPVGSVIVGSKDFITKAKRLRKTLGGGMRQVGVLCAAAYVALRDNVPKLSDDHRRAKMLAEGLQKVEHFSVDLSSVESNMVFFNIKQTSKISPDRLCEVLQERGVLAMPASSTSVRLVLHYQISDSDIQFSLTSIKGAVEQILTDGTKNGAIVQNMLSVAQTVAV